MGYELHITRRKEWHETGDNINADEWLDYVHTHSEFQLTPANGPYFAEWKISDDDEPSQWLDWGEGNIYTKNPSEPFIARMIIIAKELNAKLQGDEGEVYTENSIQESCSEPISLWSRLKSWF